jgi:alkylhydroperoxidase family enzyme
MPRIAYTTGVEGTEIHRIMSHTLGPRAKWRELDDALRSSPVLAIDVKEAVRAALATDSGCDFCASVGEPRDPGVSPPDIRTSLATTYALMLRNPADLDDTQIDVLKQEFSEAEIVELTCWSLFVIASQGFGAAMAVRAATDEEGQAYRATIDEYRKKVAALSV